MYLVESKKSIGRNGISYLEGDEGYIPLLPCLVDRSTCNNKSLHLSSSSLWTMYLPYPRISLHIFFYLMNSEYSLPSILPSSSSGCKGEVYERLMGAQAWERRILEASEVDLDRPKSNVLYDHVNDSTKSYTGEIRREIPIMYHICQHLDLHTKGSRKRGELGKSKLVIVGKPCEAGTQGRRSSL